MTASDRDRKNKKRDMSTCTYQIFESVFFGWQPNELWSRSSICGNASILCNKLVVISYIVP